ncbi:glutaminase, partial [Fulvivirga sp.]
MDYHKILAEINEEVSHLIGKGKVADYIPELAKVNKEKFAIYLLTLDGDSYEIGDAQEAFSIQSISKVFMLALMISKIGKRVYKRVDVEPSGDPFNSLVQLEHENGIPRNPFINSGALVITDMMLSHFDNPKEEMISFIRSLAGDDNIFYNESVAISEMRTGFKNAAMVNLMKSFGNIENDIDDVLELYCYCCSIEMS